MPNEREINPPCEVCETETLGGYCDDNAGWNQCPECGHRQNVRLVRYGRTEGTFRDRTGRTVTNPPSHQWQGDDLGHNCAKCGPSSTWLCDFWAHLIPLHEDDPAAHALGFHDDDCLGPQEEFHGLCGQSAVVRHLAAGLH